MKSAEFFEADFFRSGLLRSIEAKAAPGTTKVFTKTELAENFSKAELQHLDEAIDALLQAKKLFRIVRGKSVFYLHAASIAPLLGEPAKTKKKPRVARKPKAAAPTVAAASAPEISSDRVHAAYRELVAESGFSDVLISELQQRSRLALNVLQPWLRQESRAGRVLPTHGDWSIADVAARAAALEIAGDPHLRVRFVPA